MPKEFRPKNDNRLYPDYLSDDFFKLIKFAVSIAADLGMIMWIYDEGGWPSGSACGKVLELDKSLRCKEILIRSVSSPYVRGEDAVAAYCDGVRISEGFESEHEIYEYYFSPLGGDYPNLLEPETTDLFISITHERYREYIGEYFGNTVRALFTDEPVANRTSWCKDFEKIFYERYGYDILDFLPAIVADMETNVDDNCKRARVDYYNLIAELFYKNYFLKVRDWCRKYNLEFTGHLDIDNETYGKKQRSYHMLRLLRGFDIPGIDMIWRQIFPGKKNHFYPRFASSAAAQTGNRFVVSESFAIYGAGLSFEQMRYLVNYQLVRGINLFNFMSSNYDYNDKNRKNARPGFSPVLPTWRHLKEFNKYTTRMSYLMSLGKPCNQCALYLPMNKIWEGGDAAKLIIEHFDDFAWTLEQNQICFDIVDDDLLDSGKMGKKGFIVGNAEYDALLIQNDVENLPAPHDYIGLDFDNIDGVCSSEIYALDAVPPTARTSSAKITVAKRQLPSGYLYLLHNDDTQKTIFSVKFNDFGYSNVYEIDVVNSVMYAPNLSRLEYEAGEARAYLVTNESYPTVDRKEFSNSIENDSFLMKRQSRFVIGEKAFENNLVDDNYIEMTPGDWCKVYGDDYSGAVTYKVNFTLENIPDCIEIDLGKVLYSCDVLLNGVHIADLCFAPFKCVASSDILKKENELLITVSNTNANAVGAAKSLDEIPPEIIGQYHAIAKEFEKESLESGLMSNIIIRF